MTPISFIINTSRNEREYITLLLTSLLNGIDINIHEIIIFIDSDNQNTTNFLLEQKNLFPNLKIVKNNGNPIGYASNSNWLISHAKHEIISYIQSDMIVCLEYDKKILSHLTDNIILSSCRVEPPLHAINSNSITHVKNFGLTPSEFEYEKFLSFAETVKDSTKLSNYFFAPFSTYKKNWLNIGGYDIKFLKSREDSDIALRFALNNTPLIQCYDAIVYHFTCTSSRQWAIKENRNKNINTNNDEIELDRFIKKWGVFVHATTLDADLKKYIEKYPILLNQIIVKNSPIDESNFEFL